MRGVSRKSCWQAYTARHPNLDVAQSVSYQRVCHLRRAVKVERNSVPIGDSANNTELSGGHTHRTARRVIAEPANTSQPGLTSLP